MSMRSQIARLRQQAGQSNFSGDVRQISDLIDQLSAEAAGGGPPQRKVTLQEILIESHPPSDAHQGQYTQKESP